MRQVRDAAAASVGFMLILLAASAAPALAARAATDAEAAAVSAALEVEPVCSVVTVSTASTRYARWDVDRDVCTSEGDGFVILRLGDDGQWRGVHQASEGSDACPTTPLPTEVGVDLRACSRPSRHIYIGTFMDDRLLFRPRRLPHGAHSLFGRLRWRGWDRSVAMASGVLDYADAYDRFRAPIRLRAWRVRFCGARRVYTRLTLRFVRGADRRRFRHFEGTSHTGCGEGSETAVYAPRVG